MAKPPIPYACSKCGHQMDVPHHYSGQKQKCRQCGAEFVVPDEQKSSRKTSSLSSASRAPTSASGTKKCPYCAEEIKVDAVICRFCKRDLRPPSGAQKAEQVGTQMQQVGCALTKIVYGGGCLILLLIFLWAFLSSLL